MSNTPDERKNQCPEFPHFGARYPDACCIDGYLWDLDSWDGEGRLCIGGDDPCPFCNEKEYIEWRADETDPESVAAVKNYIQKLKDKYQ